MTMEENLPLDAIRIRSLASSIRSILEGAGDEAAGPGGSVTRRLEAHTEDFIEANQEILNAGSKHLVSESSRRVGPTLDAVEQAYAEWRTLVDFLRSAAARAYGGHLPIESLDVDAVLADLEQRVGEPLAALYSRLQVVWHEHLELAPWDAHLASRRNADEDRIQHNLKLLVRGDHLDLDDAITEMCGPLRHAFADYLERQTEPVEFLEESLWVRPEVIVMNDYWRGSPGVRLLDILSRKGTPRFAGAFARVKDFFAASSPGPTSRAAADITEAVRSIGGDERDVYLRCLLLHPDQEIRRYAATNVGSAGFWNVASPLAVPCATILSMLERVVGSRQYDEDYQKVFFDTVHRRLMSLHSRSDVLYTRGIVRVFSQMPFFMEDEYFEKITRLFDYLGAKESQFGIRDGLLVEYAEALRREKDRIGTLRAEAPNLTAVPPVVLRKLARDGHYWYELAMHPMFKIARETIPHASTPDRALRVARNHAANQDVLGELGRKRPLFVTWPARMALLSNPRTPLRVSLSYVADLSRGDVEDLLRRDTVHPELRVHLRNRARAQL